MASGVVTVPVALVAFCEGGGTVPCEHRSWFEHVQRIHMYEGIHNTEAPAARLCIWVRTLARKNKPPQQLIARRAACKRSGRAGRSVDGRRSHRSFRAVLCQEGCRRRSERVSRTRASGAPPVCSDRIRMRIVVHLNPTAFHTHNCSYPAPAQSSVLSPLLIYQFSVCCLRPLDSVISYFPFPSLRS